MDKEMFLKEEMLGRKVTLCPKKQSYAPLIQIFVLTETWTLEGAHTVSNSKLPYSLFAL